MSHPSPAPAQTTHDEVNPWPALFALALLEGAWLGSLAYVIHRFVLSPITG